jgi:hypothetical protein
VTASYLVGTAYLVVVVGAYRAAKIREVPAVNLPMPA